MSDPRDAKLAVEWASFVSAKLRHKSAGWYLGQLGMPIFAIASAVGLVIGNQTDALAGIAAGVVVAITGFLLDLLLTKYWIANAHRAEALNREDVTHA